MFGELLPLPGAAALVYSAATGLPNAERATLDEVARRISFRTDIFARYGTEPTHQLVTPDELRAGTIGGGGRILHFEDHRDSLVDLAVRANAVGYLIRDMLVELRVRYGGQLR